MRIFTEDSILQAVEITKAAIAGENGPWMNSPDIVAKFIETVASKLEDLRNGPPQH